MHALVDLDIVGAIEGSDKNSSVGFAWDYLRNYQRHFAPFRDQAINILEVGVKRGPSLRVWEWYFPKATIVGIDINPKCANQARGRIHIEIGSQADPVFLAKLCIDYPPTIFIDDGSHLAEHMIFTFEQVFPRLLPGGVYVIEDFQFHRPENAAKWQTETVRDAAGYFGGLMQDHLLRHKPADPLARALGSGIDSMEAVGGALIIHKRPVHRDWDHALAIATSYLESHELEAGARDRLAKYLLRHNAPAGLAEAVVREGMAMGEESSKRLGILAASLFAAGDRAGARAAAEQAVALPATDAHGTAELADLCRKLGFWAGAVIAAEAAVQLRPGSQKFKNMLGAIKRAAAAKSVPSPPRPPGQVKRKPIGAVRPAAAKPVHPTPEAKTTLTPAAPAGGRRPAPARGTAKASI